MKDLKLFVFLSALFQKFQRDNAFFLARGLAFDVVVCLIPAVFLLFKAADLSQVYGSFGLFFALVLWVYYSCIVFILGAEMG